MTIAYHDVYVHPLPENHRFPMEKYSLLAGQLKREGYGADASWIEPGLAQERDILRVHDEDYWNRLKSGQISRHDERASGFKWSPQLVRREQTIMEGTLQCARRAAKGEVALNIAGGTHHAFKDRPEGFCLLNDIMIDYQLIITDSLLSINWFSIVWRITQAQTIILKHQLCIRECPFNCTI